MHKFAKKVQIAPLCRNSNTLAFGSIKKTSMTIHKYLRKELLFLLSSSLLAFFFLAGCQKQPNLLYGNSYTDLNTGANIVLVDTSTVAMSTLYVDSTATYATGYLMVGSYSDDYIGKVSSRGYLKLTPPGSSSLPTIDPRLDNYDSIGMILFFKPGNPYYGDTTAYQTLVVNQIDTLFQPVNNQNGWYSNRSLPLGPDLGSATVRIQPNRPVSQNASNTSQGTGDTVRIPLDRALGARLYNMVYNKSDTIINITKWENWFHGLCVSPGWASNGNNIYGFMDSAIMRIYYRENGVTSTGKSIDFTLTDKSSQYNNVQHSYNNLPHSYKSPLNNIILPTQIPQIPPATPSKQIGNVGYVQTIGGLNVKLTFPSLSSIALRPDYIGLLKAVLTVRPVPGSYSTIWRLPPQVGIFETDQNNLIGLPVSAAGIGGFQTGNLVVDYFHPLNSVYTYDVTNFVKTQITNPSPNAAQTGLMLSVPAPANFSEFNRLIIADQSYPVDQRITLSVYYISLYPHQ